MYEYYFFTQLLYLVLNIRCAYCSCCGLVLMQIGGVVCNFAFSKIMADLMCTDQVHKKNL